VFFCVVGSLLGFVVVCGGVVVLWCGGVVVWWCGGMVVWWYAYDTVDDIVVIVVVETSTKSTFGALDWPRR
jgi:hypothetical protein